jgi:hypothetical protein
MRTHDVEEPIFGFFFGLLVLTGISYLYYAVLAGLLNLLF